MAKADCGSDDGVEEGGSDDVAVIDTVSFGELRKPQPCRFQSSVRHAAGTCVRHALDMCYPEKPPSDLQHPSLVLQSTEQQSFVVRIYRCYNMLHQKCNIQNIVLWLGTLRHADSELDFCRLAKRAHFGAILNNLEKQAWFCSRMQNQA